MTREEFKQKLILIAKETDKTLDMEKGWCEAHDLVCNYLDEIGYHEESKIFRDLIWYG